MHKKINVLFMVLMTLVTLIPAVPFTGADENTDNVIVQQPEVLPGDPVWTNATPENDGTDLDIWGMPSGARMSALVSDNTVNAAEVSGESGNWTLATSTVWNKGRNGHSSVIFDNKIWAIGQYAASSSPDGITWTQVNESTACLSPRYSHTSLVYDDKMWVLGGVVNPRNIVCYSEDGKTWTSVNQSSSFLARTMHSSVVFKGKMWVIGGGNNSYGFYNDSWYSTDGITWTQATNSTGFQPRAAHTSVVFDDKMWVIGGIFEKYQKPTVYFNDVWYSSDGIVWEPAVKNADFPPHYYQSSVVFDGKMWIIGGYSPGLGGMDDVWYSSDGVKWTQLNNSLVFSKRYSHSSEVFNNKIWVIGGYDGTITNDAWYWPPDPPQRLTVEVQDSVTKLPVVNSTIGLYDFSRNLWWNVTVSSGSYTFKTTDLQQQSPLVPGTTYHIAVSADGYSPVSRNVTFVGDGQAEIIVLVKIPEVFTYSITNTNGAKNKTTNQWVWNGNAESDIDQMTGYFSNNNNWNNIQWKQAFYLKGSEVTKGTFGFNPRDDEPTINDATLHYHAGHGSDWPAANKSMGLALLDSDFNNVDPLYPREVREKWGRNNKWVILQSCFPLRDDEWVHAFASSHGTHGILSFKTVSYAHPKFMETFFQYAKTNSVRDAYFLTVRQYFSKTKIKMPDGTEERLTAATVFSNQQQAENDYLPGFGSGIQPDTDRIEVKWDQWPPVEQGGV